MNRYETVFILTPVLSEEQTKEAVNKFENLIKASGTITHQENWGIKKLAYPIEKKNTGYYCLIEFESDPTFIQKLETEYHRDEKIIRHLVVKMEKEHLAFAEKRRDKNAR